MLGTPIELGVIVGRMCNGVTVFSRRVVMSFMSCFCGGIVLNCPPMLRLNISALAVKTDIQEVFIPHISIVMAAVSHDSGELDMRPGINGFALSYACK